MLFYNEKIFQRCFGYPKRYWYRNIRNIPRYFKQMHHLIKYGYDEYATWETYDWFMQTMKPILVNYRDNMNSTPIIVDNYPWQIKTDEDRAIVKENEAKWNSIVDRMITLLDEMDEYNSRYDDDKYQANWPLVQKEITAAKDEFFELFSKHFFALWD